MSDAPLVGVLALQGDVREHARALEAAGARAVPVRRAHELARVDALVLPGGESTTIAKLARTFELFEPLRDAVAAGMPMFGSCAGMILLADTVLDGIDGQETFGGLDVNVRRNAFGRQVDSFEADIDFPGFASGGPVHAVFIRAPWVESVGPGVQVLAELRTGHPGALPSRLDPVDVETRIVAVRQGRLLATSFHPELTGELRVHALFVDMVRERRATAATS